MTFPHLPLPLLQLLDIAGSLLERPVVAQDASERYLVLIRMFSEDLDAVRLIHSQRVQEEAEHGKLAAKPSKSKMKIIALSYRFRMKQKLFKFLF